MNESHTETQHSLEMDQMIDNGLVTLYDGRLDHGVVIHVERRPDHLIYVPAIIIAGRQSGEFRSNG